MSAVAKKRPTERLEIQVGDQPLRLYLVPKSAASGLLAVLKDYQVQSNEESWISAEEVFPELTDVKERAASALRGARYKAQMTQGDLAVKLKITQGDLSKMEHGKRPIGKKLAMRLSEILNIDYRVFL